MCDCDTRSLELLSWAEVRGVALVAVRAPGHLFLRLPASKRSRAVNFEPLDGTVFCDGTEPFAERICRTIRGFSRPISLASVHRGAFLVDLEREAMLAIATSNVGAVLLSQGESERALALQRRAAARHGADPLVQFRFAEALLAHSAENAGQAAHHSEAALWLDPHTPYPHILRGRLAGRARDEALAERHLRKAAHLGRADAHAHALIGQAYRELSAPRAARRAFQRALKLTESSALRASLERRIEALRPASERDGSVRVALRRAGAGEKGSILASRRPGGAPPH